MPSIPIKTSDPRSRELLRILVIDDSPDAAHALAAVLRELGFVAQGAVGGLDGLERAAQLKPHAVLLDLAMPMMDGIETAAALRALPGGEKTALIALTGWDRPEDFERTRASGFSVHLVKPISIDALTGVLDEIEPHE